MSQSSEHMSMQQCCDAILADKDNKALNWAIGYARAGRDMSGADAKVQALYILNNMTHWRGDVAKRVRANLKRIGGVK